MSKKRNGRPSVRQIDPTTTVITPQARTRPVMLWRTKGRCDIATFKMREVDGTDQAEAAIWAEANVDPAQKSNPVALMQQEQHEMMRLSLVEVDGVPVNHDGIPFKELDHWSLRTLRFITYAFNHMNGADSDELKNFEAEAQIVGTEATSAQDTASVGEH